MSEKQVPVGDWGLLWSSAMGLGQCDMSRNIFHSFSIGCNENHMWIIITYTKALQNS